MNYTCFICNLLLNSSILLHFGHQFHRQCFMTYLITNNVCPVPECNCIINVYIDNVQQPSHSIGVQQPNMNQAIQFSVTTTSVPLTTTHQPTFSSSLFAHTQHHPPNFPFPNQNMIAGYDNRHVQHHLASSSTTQAGTLSSVVASLPRSNIPIVYQNPVPVPSLPIPDQIVSWNRNEVRTTTSQQTFSSSHVTHNQQFHQNMLPLMNQNVVAGNYPLASSSTTQAGTLSTDVASFHRSNIPSMQNPVPTNRHRVMTSSISLPYQTISSNINERRTTKTQQTFSSQLGTHQFVQSHPPNLPNTNLIAGNVYPFDASRSNTQAETISSIVASLPSTFQNPVQTNRYNDNIWNLQSTSSARPFQVDSNINSSTLPFDKLRHCRAQAVGQLLPSQPNDTEQNVENNKFDCNVPGCKKTYHTIKQLKRHLQYCTAKNQHQDYNESDDEDPKSQHQDYNESDDEVKVMSENNESDDEDPKSQHQDYNESDVKEPTDKKRRFDEPEK